MKDIRNANGHLIAMLDEQSETIVIRLKDCITTIIRKPDGTYEITNSRTSK